MPINEYILSESITHKAYLRERDDKWIDLYEDQTSVTGKTRQFLRGEINKDKIPELISWLKELEGD